jgi:predicted ATPase
VRSVRLERIRVPSFDAYPFSIPVISKLDELELDRGVTFLVGENGSGKSTLLEAIAVAYGFNAEGGGKHFSFATRRSDSDLHRFLRLIRDVRRPSDGFFLRAESYFNVATEIENLDVNDPDALVMPPRIIDSYGGQPLHEQSHGQSFLALVQYRFRGEGFYILDEPEAALSPNRQLTLLALMHDLVESRGSQFIIATHSPILMAYPCATLYCLGDEGDIRRTAYEDTDHYRLTKDFLADRDRFFRHLLHRTDE